MAAGSVERAFCAFLVQPTTASCIISEPAAGRLGEERAVEREHSGAQIYKKSKDKPRRVARGGGRAAGSEWTGTFLAVYTGRGYAMLESRPLENEQRG